MNRTIKIIISVVLCVWIFAMGLELGAYRERKAINATLSGNNPASSTTTTTKPSNDNIVIETPSATQPQTSETSKPDDTTAAPSGSTEPTEEKKPASTVPQTNEEIAAAFNKAMNATKHSTKSCNAVKNTDVKIQVTDCSVSSLTGMVNSIAQRFTGPETAEYSFVDGKATTSDGEITINDDFPPSGRDTTLDAGGIAKASAEPYGDGGYKLSITLIPETSSLGNEPKYHANTVGYLDLEGLGISGVTFTEANFTYPGATVTICVNGDGLVETYDCTLPMSGTGAGNIKIASASATLEGTSTENWQFTWL